MFVLSSMQPDAARRKKGRSKPDRVFRQSPGRLRLYLKDFSPRTLRLERSLYLQSGDRRLKNHFAFHHTLGVENMFSTRDFDTVP